MPASPPVAKPPGRTWPGPPRTPTLLLLDEPTGNLDPATAVEVFGFLVGLHAELRPTTLLVTHNPGLAERYMRTVRLG